MADDIPRLFRIWWSELTIGIVFSLIGCAQPGVNAYDGFTLVQTNVEVCTMPAVQAAIISQLNGKIGQPDGPPAQVISVSGLRSGQTAEEVIGADSPIQCRGEIVTENGAVGPGTVSVSDPVMGIRLTSLDGGSPVSVSWTTDAAQAEADAKQAAYNANSQDVTAQWSRAVRQYSLHHTPLETSQFDSDANECLSEAENASVILQTERELISQGNSPQSAARFAIENNNYPDIAQSALNQPADVRPNDFSEAVMKACLETIKQ